MRTTDRRKRASFSSWTRLAGVLGGLTLVTVAFARSEPIQNPAIAAPDHPRVVAKASDSPLPDSEERLREQIRTARLGPSVVRAGGPPLSVPSLKSTNSARPPQDATADATEQLAYAAIASLGGLAAVFLCVQQLRTRRRSSSRPPELRVRNMTAEAKTFPDAVEEQAEAAHSARPVVFEPLTVELATLEPIEMDGPGAESAVPPVGVDPAEDRAQVPDFTHTSNTRRGYAASIGPLVPRRIQREAVQAAARITPLAAKPDVADEKLSEHGQVAPVPEAAAPAAARLDQIEQSLLAVTNLLRGVAMNQQVPPPPVRRKKRRRIRDEQGTPGLPSSDLLAELRRDHEAGLLSTEELETKLADAWSYFLDGEGEAGAEATPHQAPSRRLDETASGLPGSDVTVPPAPPKPEPEAIPSELAAARIARSPRYTRRPGEAPNLEGVRERVLELAGKGHSTSEICEAVALGPHEVNLILKTLFRRS